jgi:anti-sigma factor RsiW
MNCRNAESLFSAFLDDELTQGERRHFESHLLGCRRCSQSVRELRGAMALVNEAVTASAVETSPHFEDDLMDRIRSGEAMRPTVIEWIQSFLVPDRLRPVFLVGATACAVFAAVVLFQGGFWKADGGKAPAMASRSNSNGAPAVASASEPKPATTEEATAVTPPATELASAVPPATSATHPIRKTAPRSNDANGIVEIADRVVPATGGQTGSLIPDPESQFVDEYVNDNFFLQRGGVVADPQQPSLVPVSDKGSDGVYIEF